MRESNHWKSVGLVNYELIGWVKLQIPNHSGDIMVAKGNTLGTVKSLKIYPQSAGKCL